MNKKELILLQKEIQLLKKDLIIFINNSNEIKNIFCELFDKVEKITDNLINNDQLFENKTKKLEFINYIKKLKLLKDEIK